MTGFDFTSTSHDIWKMGSLKSGSSKFDYKFESTAAEGQTLFMKLTSDWMKASGANKWNGEV